MTLVQIDARNTTVIHLAEELLKVGSTLMPHPSMGEQPTRVACLEDTNREINILAKTHLTKSTQLLECLSPNSHVIRPWVEFV